MGLIGHAFNSVAVVLGMAIDIYKILVLAAVVITWVRPDPFHPLVKFVTQVTDPVFKWLRSRLPQSLFSTGIDPTPILVFFILVFAENFVVNSLSDMGRNMVYNSRSPNTIIMSGEGNSTDDAVFKFK